MMPEVDLGLYTHTHMSAHEHTRTHEKGSLY